MTHETPEPTAQWDKVFPQSDAVDHEKVAFRTRFGITLVADLYKPKDARGQSPALAVAGPFGAVKEQSSGLYAQTMAERGYLTIAFDPSFTGESGGEPRCMNSPDINIEDFQAAVDFLSVRDDVDPGRIGIIGICGWGGMALAAAAADPRIRATVASTMYDMSRVAAKGYFDSADSAEERNRTRASVAAQRTTDYRSGVYAMAGGVVDPLPEDAPAFVKDYYDYYKTPRGYHPVPELQRRLDRHRRVLADQRHPAGLHRGDRQRRHDRPRRGGPLLLHGQGRLRPAHGRQQGARDHSRRRPHRPVRRRRQERHPMGPAHRVLRHPPRLTRTRASGATRPAAGRPGPGARSGHSDDRARVRPTARPAQAMASANRAHTPQSASRGPMASADIEAAVCAPEIARTAQ